MKKNKKSYGYYFGLDINDVEDITHLIIFKNKVDFDFYILNWKYIYTTLKKYGWEEKYRKKYGDETEIIYEKDDKKLYFYIDEKDTVG